MSSRGGRAVTGWPELGPRIIRQRKSGLESKSSIKEVAGSGSGLAGLHKKSVLLGVSFIIIKELARSGRVCLSKVIKAVEV